MKGGSSAAVANRAIDGWIASMRAEGCTALELVAAVGHSLVDAAHLPVGDTAPSLLQGPARCSPPPDLELSVWTLGRVFELALDQGDRRRLGAHYTPAPVARQVTTIAFDVASSPGPDVTVCDPAVGGGAFLLAAGEELLAQGLSREEIVRDRLWGIDIDAGACAVATLALALWASTEGRWVQPGEHLACADALVAGAAAFGGRRFEIVVGNPPFLGQLETATARSADESHDLRHRWDVDTGPFADAAAFFLLVGHELCADDGVVAFIEPQSVLVSADAAGIREAVTDRMTVAGLWTADREVFDANVRVCAPVLRRSSARTEVRRWVGEDAHEVAAARPVVGAASWAPLMADLLGVPEVDLPLGPTLGETCTATAGFRDQFYGLAAHCVDAEPTPGTYAPLVTVGMIDPFRNRWGAGPFRFAKQRWATPCVDLAGLAAAEPTLAAWVRERTEPKVLVATQTRVIEVVVDEEGDLVPSTPVIAVVPPAGRLFHIAAALSSPVASALAFREAAGAALSADTLRLSATQVLGLPTPVDPGAWDEGAAIAQEATAAAADSHETAWVAALRRLGPTMCAAHGLDARAAEAVLDWWLDRLPPWR